MSSGTQLEFETIEKPNIKGDIQSGSNGVRAQTVVGYAFDSSQKRVAGK